MAKVLVVGQVPPPYHGQAIAVSAMLAEPLPGHTLVHVPMHFSRSIDRVGKFRVGKLAELVLVVFRIYSARIREKPDALYYPPAGDSRVAVYRDIAILLLTRWLFPKTAYHFHACGLLVHYERAGLPMKALMRLAYGRPDLAIINSHYNPPDADFLGPREIFEVCYGIDWHPRVERGVCVLPPTILMVSQLFPEKGLHDLLAALAQLKKRGVSFRFMVAGSFSSHSYEKKIRSLVHNYELTSDLHLLGQVTGDDLIACYETADVFCFPSYYPMESFGIVLLEAMRAGLPIVASRWRGVQSAVTDGVNGFLVERRDISAFAEKLELMLCDAALRKRMGNAGRERFEKEFTKQAWLNRLARAFDSIA